MDLKQKLLDMSREATGDPDVVVAGDFQPKGMTWKRAVGAAAGGAAGGAVGGDVAQTIGVLGGYAAGSYAATSGKLPPVVVLAASPTTLYLMMTNNGKGIILAKSLVVFDKLSREHLSVELKQRVNTRTAVIKDESTGHEYKIEGRRILFHHMNDMLNALAAADEPVDKDEEKAAGLAEPVEHPA